MSSFLRDLESRIATAMQADRFRLRNLLRAVQKAEEEGRPPDDQLEKLLKQLDESNTHREKRQSLVPRLDYDESLPVVARRDEIAAAIRVEPEVTDYQIYAGVAAPFNFSGLVRHRRRLAKVKQLESVTAAY
jgi:hypothetical protein